MEAALAAQMAAVHVLATKVAARAIRDDYDTRTVAVAVKLARTFTMQMETMRTMQGKRRAAKQLIKVTKELHQHVHDHQHPGEEENGGQAHEPRAATTGERPALLSPQPGGEVVSLPSHARKKGV
jgi:hypothetical protein